jgi:hypothetical protein
MWQTPLYSTTKLTLELREIIENGIDIFDFDYDGFYEGEAKKAFERKVVEHYYFRQIGSETVGRFKHELRAKMREIMPYYKQLYESVELMANVGDPFEAYNLTETFTKTTTGKASGTSEDVSESSENGKQNGKANNKTRFSDTPQGSIDNLDNYLTNATIVNGDSEESSERSANGKTTNTNSTDASGTEDYTLTRRGNIGVQPLGQEMEYYRKALINVDMMVINELNELFLLVY